MNKYKILLVGESPVFVLAERMELLEGALTLYEGDEIKAFYPNIVGVEVDLPPKPAPCSPVELRSGALAEAAFFEPLPAISIGSVYITGVLPESAAAVASFIQGLTARADRPLA